MILHSLHDLYTRLAEDPSYGVAPAGYSLQKITFKVVLTPDGEFLSIEDTRTQEGNRWKPRQLIVPGNNKPPGSGINPCFLWDNSQYMLGFKVEDPKPERTIEAFSAFKARHLEAETAIGDIHFSAVCHFLASWEPSDAEGLSVLEDAATTGFGVFQIAGKTRLVHESPAVRAWWAGRETDDAERMGQCLITGKEAPLARIHHKIRGVIGGQGSGGTIVGFNDNAYESYGQSQSYNAPVSKDAAFRYVGACNALLDGPQKKKHSTRLGDTTILFWTDEPSGAEDFFAQFAAQGSLLKTTASPQDSEVRERLGAFLEALRRGKEAYGGLDTDPARSSYYLLGLSPNSARISVRFFHRGTVASLLNHLRSHHEAIRLVRRPSKGKWQEDPEFPSLQQLLDQSARETKHIPPLLAAPLLGAIVSGTPYPLGLYTSVLRRVRAEQSVDYLKCCLIKGYLNRNLNLGVSMGLDTERGDVGYRLGRLFAALEKTQRDALGANLNTTIRDSFYSSASATPRSVFPRLLRTYQHHLAKLQGGLRVNRERLVQEILGPLTGFPAHLNLEGQGVFAIGYYHQTDAFYRKPPTTDTEEDQQQ